MRVAFQGIHGAYSEQALRDHFGSDVESVPCDNFYDLFNMVQERQVDYGFLPIENSTAGAVHQAYELLIEHDFRIQAEYVFRVHHALIAPPNVAIEDIRRVISHPQALMQCNRYLRRNNFEPVTWWDTSGSVRDLPQENDGHTAAIAGEYAAELYGMQVLQRQIEDEPFNFTRFFVLGHEETKRAEYNKTSLVFATRHQPASLYECIGEFATRGINLTKLESRPRRNRPWDFVFYVDFEGHWEDEHCREALTALLQKASFVKMLGSYPGVKIEPMRVEG